MLTTAIPNATAFKTRLIILGGFSIFFVPFRTLRNNPKTLSTIYNIPSSLTPSPLLDSLPSSLNVTGLSPSLLRGLPPKYNFLDIKNHCLGYNLILQLVTFNIRHFRGYFLSIASILRHMRRCRCLLRQLLRDAVYHNGDQHDRQSGLHTTSQIVIGESLIHF